MNEPGHDLFTGTALSRDQDLGLTARRVVNLFVERKNCGTCPNEFGWLH